MGRQTQPGYPRIAIRRESGDLPELGFAQELSREGCETEIVSPLPSHCAVMNLHAVAVYEQRTLP